MKKECFAAALLVILFALSLLHAGKLARLSASLTAETDRAADRALRGDWQAAEDAAKSALALWQESAGYTRVSLKHSDIDAVDDALYDLLQSIRSRDAAASSVSAELLRRRLEDLCEMERLSPGSVF